MLGLYIHIPFCSSICSYCDFPKMLAKEEVKEKYINYLIEELHSYEGILNEVESVYIGGGTPNSLNDNLLEKLLKEISKYTKLSKENTIEINSELLTNNQCLLFKKYNINRVSIGVQTFNPKLIRIINRHHTKDIVFNAVNLLRNNGINNINIDMMYGLPYQSIDDLKEDIAIALALNPPHLSYYSLILEKKTLLDYQIKHNQITIPDDDKVADMAIYLNQILKMNMFKHYEISNYAKDGYESIHNLIYWNCTEYVGIGASACGYINNIRYQNNSILSKYYDNYRLSCEKIDQDTAKSEYMMLGLRKLEGICIEDYFQRFKTYPNNDFDINKLMKLGLIEQINGFIRIKEDKYLLGNIVFEEFVR